MKSLIGIIRRYDLHSTGKWLVLSALIGIVAGLGAIVFQFLTQAIQAIALIPLAGYVPGEAAGEHPYLEPTVGAFTPWILVAVMAIGGLISGWIVYTFAPEAEGHGTDAAIDAFHNKRGDIRARIPFIKTITSALTIGTAGSAGREGPIAQIGAGFGAFLASKLKLSARDRRIMMAAGMSAGVGAIFRAPLAGALFSGEILYREADLESDVVVPSAVASTVAYSIYNMTLPPELRFTPLFGELKFHVVSPLELLPYTALAVILTAVAVLYIKTFYGTHNLFKKLPIIPHLRPAIGATLAGLVGLALYYAYGADRDLLAVLATGYGTLQKAFSANQPAVHVLLAVALVKIITTSLTIGSGGSGGVFGPSMVVGGCLGAAVGQVFHQWWPEVITQPQAFAIVGMAGFFAGAARAPFSTILMVSEMTGDYKLLLPTMWVATICFLLCSRWTLYIKQVPSRLDSPAHRGDFIVDLLEGITVSDVYQKNRKIRLVQENATLDEIVHLLAKTSQRYFPVVDARERMVGIFSAEDVRAYLYDDSIWQIANARDVMTTKIVTVTPEDDLNLALKKFTALNLDELPVVEPDDPTKLIGILRRKETIAAYNRRVMEHKQSVEQAEVV
ncbi:MAG: chloride channel protein [Planctomycetales bacterium]|nr:chloride channel protein [Planctomycetales bacterium]